MLAYHDHAGRDDPRLARKDGDAAPLQCLPAVVWRDGGAGRVDVLDYLGEVEAWGSVTGATGAVPPVHLRCRMSQRGSA